MELYTRILLPKARFSFSYEDRVVMMGSCFAENIGRKLEENKFSVDINPFGTLYRSEERRVGKECRSRWSPYH